MSLPVSEYYEVVVTEDPEHEGLDCYGIRNLEHGVVEYYDNLLPRTYDAMEGMDKLYIEMNRKIDGMGQLEIVTPEATH